jgi:hypothetical protein
VVVRGTTAAVSPSMTTRKQAFSQNHGGGFACVDHPGVDFLAGDHEPALTGDAPCWRGKWA